MLFFDMIFDILYQVGNDVEFFCLFIGNFNSEFVFDLSKYIYSIKAVCIEVQHEIGLRFDQFGIYIQLLRNQVSNFFKYHYSTLLSFPQSAGNFF